VRQSRAIHVEDDPALTRARMALLAAAQREALILVGASGLSYEEAAAICGCAVGTMKSSNQAAAAFAAAADGCGVQVGCGCMQTHK
jgi:RNA polymerase sigma-70 factor (ECF subfamily)